MIEKGFHYILESSALIEISQVKLTTKTTKLDRNLLIIDIKKFLNLPSNYDIKGKITFIIK